MVVPPRRARLPTDAVLCPHASERIIEIRTTLRGVEHDQSAVSARGRIGVVMSLLAVAATAVTSLAASEESATTVESPATVGSVHDDRGVPPLPLLIPC